ncbi:succinate dehydrogenase, hydrophobic membrane anchor protein [Camelimonas abortus]|uniref:Succinate dehydrogenase hydrophobic membrane anchor subunit n=1 Tax=Camelimonas abortus TaxID=1017184 RepID=A0ABV7LCF7_9HYPH
MASAHRSFRTPRAAITGLGAAHHGTEHFWRQRLTAIANLLLTVPFLWVLALAYGADFQNAAAVISHPLSAIVLLLMVISASIHMRLGMAVVIEDYVPEKGRRAALVIANTFFCALIGLVGVFAVLKLSLGRFV